MNSSEARVAIHLCTEADRAEQARLFNACFRKKLDASGLAWRYDHNPHGRALSFVSRPAGGEGVSGYACSPRLALAHGDLATQAVIGETGDVMTHPDWRKRGLFSALDRAAMAEASRLGWPVTFGLPNRRSAHIFLELAWKAVGRVRTWTFLFRADAAACAARAREGRARGWLAGLGARRCARLRHAARATAGSSRVIALERFPSEVLALSRSVAQRHALMVQRDAEYLNWRFIESPSRLHRALGLFDAQGGFQGYVVVQLPRAGEPQGYLVDVLAADGDAEARLVEAGLARLEESNASYVEATAIDGSWWSCRLRTTGFLAPKPANHLIVIVHVHTPGHPLAAAALDPAQWYFTDGDRDDETMG